MINIQEIMQLLPHRYPFLLVDRVDSFVAHETISARKNVAMNEPFFVGHFPGNPIMPGVLILEALAQAAGILAFKSQGLSAQSGQYIYFAGIDECRFKRPVVPGDVLQLEVEQIAMKRNIGKFKCRALVDGVLAAEATMMAALR